MLGAAPVSKQERLARIRGGRGVDWFPSWARTPVDYWGSAMPQETAARELRLVAGLGLDHVRIWLSAAGYEQDPACYLGNLRFLLDTAAELHLGVVVELFDSCGCEPGDATTVRIEQVPALSLGAPGLRVLEAMAGDRRRDIFDSPALVEVPWTGDPIVALWEGFVPNPGYAHLSPEHWWRWDTYAEAVITCIRDHPATLMLEVMNEPFITQLGVPVDLEPIVAFYRHVTELARELAPELPLAIGAEQPNIAAHNDNVPDLDVVSFHSLAGLDALHEAIKVATAVAAGRPIYLSEWGYFPGGSDGDQLAEIERLLPVVQAADMGWAITHLIAGYGPFANTALLYPSGVMRPAAVHLREQLRQKAGS